MKDWEYKPAADQDLTPIAALRSHRRESGMLSRMVQAVWRGSCLAYLKLYHRLTVSGRHHFPAGPPFVIVANHCSHLDGPSLVAALPVGLRHLAYPVAAADTFFKTMKMSLFGALLFNALPLWRRGGVRHALTELRERMELGDVILILFPEGTRSRDGTMADFKPGIGLLLAGSDIPVVPCHIAGAFEALPAPARLPRPASLHVAVGEPISFADTPNDRAGWEEVATRLSQAVRQAANDG